MRSRFLAPIFLGALTVAGGVAHATTFVRVRDAQILVRSEGPPIEQVSIPLSSSTQATVCGVEPRALYGQAVPDGGTFSLLAPFDPASLNSSGRIAFFSNIAGSTRNQAIFTADANGIEAVVTGCGGGGGSGNPGTGCGDPSPIGGTFSGLFGGTAFAPAINDSGDVLFLADIHLGSAPRGLFLYRAATRQIAKVAAVGDPSPLGGTLGAVGPGSLNNDQEVVFLASAQGTTDADIFLWDGIGLSKVAAVGDTAPGGGTIALLGRETVGFVDGSFLPMGPVPDINDSGQVAFAAILAGFSDRGIILSEGGAQQWYVRAGDSTPAGGGYFDFWAPVLNNRGEVAFFGDYQLSPGDFSSAWFVGSPGSWRKALGFLDSVDGGQVYGLAVSRNPMQPLDDQGNLLVWCDLSPAGDAERLVVSPAIGDLLVVARQGDPTPLGGQYGWMQPWVSLRTCSGTLSALTPGSPGGVLDAHFVFQWSNPSQSGSNSVLLPQEGSCVGEGLCATGEILVTAPLDGETLDCRSPAEAATRPIITWDPGNYDRFRVQVSWNSSFPDKQRISSGDTLLTGTQWKPGAKAWRRACNSTGSELYVRVLGIDRDVDKDDPLRRIFSNVVTTSLLR